MLISVAYLAQGRTAPEENEMALTIRSWEYACADIPTRHLEECFHRALKAKRDTFPFSAPEVNKQWDDMQQELLREAAVNPSPLRLPAGNSGFMTIGEFKARHDLPESWALGDPYPPESDLYKKRPQAEQLFRCWRCKDAGWTRMPYNATLGLPPKLMRCEC